eukprot:910953-Prymnesium_polylepis.1
MRASSCCKRDHGSLAGGLRRAVGASPMMRAASRHSWAAYTARAAAGGASAFELWQTENCAAEATLAPPPFQPPAPKPDALRVCAVGCRNPPHRAATGRLKWPLLSDCAESGRGTSSGRERTEGTLRAERDPPIEPPSSRGCCRPHRARAEAGRLPDACLVSARVVGMATCSGAAFRTPGEEPGVQPTASPERPQSISG